MNTLRQVLEFVGLSGPQKFVPRLGNSGFSDPTMRTVVLQVPLLSNDERFSLRAMIGGMQRLPPISLEAEAEASAGEVPFIPAVHVHSTNGVILETTGAISQNGVSLLAPSVNHGAADISLVIGQLNEPGSYQFEVTRVGIPSTGITTLRKTFEVVAKAHPAPPPPPTPDPDSPSIAVQSKGDGSFVVSGSGFLPNAPVFILVGDGTLKNPLNFTVTSDPAGNFAGFPTGNICSAPLATRKFLANDGRLKPSDHSQLVSNPITLTCPA